MDKKNFGYVLASKLVGEKKMPVRFMYREKSEGSDSGWRFFAGIETQEYADDPDNIGIYDVSTIIAADGSIAEYLDHPAGTAFEREGVDGKFTLIPDFGFEPEEG